jgi:pimeloyl-ACP methyl ester carboxylesterase
MKLLCVMVAIRHVVAAAFMMAAIVMPIEAIADKANVFFIHGANVSEEEARVWAAAMFKGLYQAGANMEFYPVAWLSDIGPDYNYHENVSNAFVTASFIAPRINSVPGRRIVIAHSLGTMVAAAAIQDYGMQVEKLIMLNSAIPSEAFDPSLSDCRPENHLVNDEWVDYRSECWVARWHELFDATDDRSKLTWKGRFSAVANVAVNFYSSGDEVLAIYTDEHNPPVLAGVLDSSTKGRWAWHKQEILKGEKGRIIDFGSTDWSGWSFSKNSFFLKKWSAAEANGVSDISVFRTNTVFGINPASMNGSSIPRLLIDAHLAQGIPALSPPAGITDLSGAQIKSIDMNSPVLIPNGFTFEGRISDYAGCVLHSDIKDVAYFFTHRIFEEIVKEGDLK